MKGEVTRLHTVTVPEDEVELDLAQIWGAMMRRKWIIIGMFLIAAVAAYVASDLMTPVYQATTTLLVKTEDIGLPGLLLDGAGVSARSGVQRAVEVFKSRTLALRTAQALGYDWDEYSPELTSFRNSISVQVTTASDLLKISVDHTDPQEAERIANMLVRVFIDQTQEMNSASVRSAREFVGQQLARFEAELEAAEEELVRFKEEMSVSQLVGESESLLGGETKALIDGVVRLETLRAEAQVAREAAQQRLAALQGEMSAPTRSVVSGTVVANDPVISGIRSQLVNLEAQLAAALEQYTERHPRVVGLQAQINELRAEMTREMARLELTDAEVYFSQEIVGIQAEILGQSARIDALDRLIADREALLSTVPQKELHLARLMRHASVTESIYTMLLRRYEEMRISEAMESSQVVVLDPAIVPGNPIKPRKQLNVAIAGFLGLFVGVGLAFLFEYLDTTFRHTEELEAYLGLPVLGRMPTYELGVKERNRQVS